MNRKQKMMAALDSLFTAPKPSPVEQITVEEIVDVVENASSIETFTPGLEISTTSPNIMVPAEISVMEVGAVQPVMVYPAAPIADAAPIAPVVQPASPIKSEIVDEDKDRQLVIFQLCDELYGVNIEAVDVIIKIQPITVVPHTPNYVRGVTNLRGTVLPVFDLRKRFGLEARPLTKDSRIIVVRKYGNIVGMIVDSVTEVIQVHDSECEPTPNIVSTVDSSYVDGIARTKDQLIILLDLDRVLHVQQRGNSK